MRVENGHTFFDNSPAYLDQALAASLKRLRTDHIDLYQVHNPSLAELEQVTAPGGALEALLAAKAGAPILPVGAYTRHKYVVNRWDAYEVPLPFSRLSYVVGEPILVPRRYDVPEMKARLVAALHEATMQAKANYYAGKGME